MGYTTDFVGGFAISPVLKEAHKNYLIKFSDTRRMQRDEHLELLKNDPIRELVGLPVGNEGCFYVGSQEFAGQDHNVVSFNKPPMGQPGLWCDWSPNDDGSCIVWNGREKFYYYEEWLQYIIDNFLEPWGYKLNGIVNWQGEDSEDIGTISITDNKITIEQ